MPVSGNVMAATAVRQAGVIGMIALAAPRQPSPRVPPQAGLHGIPRWLDRDRGCRRGRRQACGIKNPVWAKAGDDKYKQTQTRRRADADSKPPVDERTQGSSRDCPRHALPNRINAGDGRTNRHHSLHRDIFKPL